MKAALTVSGQRLCFFDVEMIGMAFLDCNMTRTEEADGLRH